MSKITYELDWDAVEEACQKLGQQLKQHSFKGLIPVSRGGLVPATILSHLLKVPLHWSVSTTRQLKMADGTPLETAKVFVDPPYSIIPFGAQKFYCIVDDIYDTGATYERLKVIYPNCMHAFAFTNNKQVPSDCVIGATLLNTDNAWIKFPWEVSLRRS